MNESENVSDSSDEYEEVLVYLPVPHGFDLSEGVEMAESSLNSAEPVCTINGQTYQGQYVMNLGSQAFFETTKNKENSKEGNNHDERNDEKVLFRGITTTNIELNTDTAIKLKKSHC
jgi:hypothetical protein